MSRRLLLLLLPLFLMTAGCIDIEVRTKIEENGSGVQTWRFSGTALLASQIKQQIDRNPFFGKGITKDQYKEGDYILESSIAFQDVSELRNLDRDVRFVSRGWLMKTHTYTEVWKRTGKEGGFLQETVRGIVPVNLKIAVELPGEIVESNADSTEAGVAQWSIPISDLAFSKILTATSRSVNWVLVIPGIVVLLGAFAALSVVVYSSIRKSRAPATPHSACPSCGARVPGGSTFCNFCGNKL